MFHKNRVTAAHAIIEILDEVSPPLPSDQGKEDPVLEADLHVGRLEHLVNLFGGARMAIAIKILQLFEDGWIPLASAARENHAKNDEEAMRMIMETVGLNAEMSHFQLSQLKTFLVRTLPAVKRATNLSEDEKIMLVAGRIKESPEGIGIGVERNVRNANVLTSKNPSLTKEEADIVVAALKSGEISRDLEALVEGRKATPSAAGAGAPAKVQCHMITVSPAGETEFRIHVPYDMCDTVERLLSRYFEVVPY